MAIRAFPITPTDSHHGWNGMTLRDYFAAAALQGLLAGAYRDSSQQSLNQLAVDVGQIADAMIAEREKRDGKD